MKLIVLCLIFLTCMTADKDEQSVKLHRNLSNLSNTNFEEFFTLSTEESEINILNVQPEGNFFKTILRNFIVDDERSAITHLSSSYRIAMVTIRNKKNYPINLTERSFRYKDNNTEFKPIRSIKEYPRRIGCINWKGNIKNLYNTLVITSATVFIVGAFVVCAKEGKCEGLRYTDDVFKLSKSGETDPDKTFSPPLFNSEFTYSDILDLEFPLALEASEVKRGMILYPTPLDWKDSRRAILSANCIVQ